MLKISEVLADHFNNLFPPGTLPHERLQYLVDTYNHRKALALKSWLMLQEVKTDIEKFDSAIDTAELVDSEATYDGGILKIVINEILPRRCVLKDKELAAISRRYWTHNIADAIKHLRDIWG